MKMKQVHNKYINNCIIIRLRTFLLNCSPYIFQKHSDYLLLIDINQKDVNIYYLHHFNLYIIKRNVLLLYVLFLHKYEMDLIHVYLISQDNHHNIIKDLRIFLPIILNSIYSLNNVMLYFHHYLIHLDLNHVIEKLT